MYSKGFLLDAVDMSFNIDTFSNHHRSIFLQRDDPPQAVQAYDSTLRYEQNTLMGVLGEFFEREILINANTLVNTTIPATSLRDGSTIEIETNKIVFAGKFIDSCGMSSHTRSDDTIYSSFLEFLERQSLVFNYLSKSPGFNLKKALDQENKNRDLYIHQFVNETFYFDISLHESIKVVILLGIGEFDKGVGLGTHPDINVAIEKAQNELIHNFSTSFTKYADVDSINQGDKNLTMYTQEEQMDLYHSNFNKLSPSELKIKYEYLLTNSPNVYNIHSYEFDLKQVIKDLHHRYSFEPFIVVIPSSRDIPHLKVTKVIDVNWFPHMNPSHFDEAVYSFVEKNTNKWLRRDVSYIPFP